MTPLHTCACGAEYDLAGWLALPRAASGVMTDGDRGYIELHNCPCGSTRAMDVDVQTVPLTLLLQAIEAERWMMGEALSTARTELWAVRRELDAARKPTPAIPPARVVTGR